MSRPRPTRCLAALVGAALLAVTAPTAPAPAATTAAGGLTSGDSLFPHQGNSGYDARRYDVSLSYAPATRSIRAVSTMRAVARRPLTSFGLDLEGLHVRHVVVDGRRAAFERTGTKLVVKPHRALRAGRAFTATVRYDGKPGTHSDPDESTEGWITTTDGAVALNEPVGAMTWFPNNNTLRDKALYSFTVRAPKSLEVAANGHLVRRTTKGEVSTWRYVMDQPMASYLAMVGIGQYRIHHGRTRDGIRLLSFSDTTLPAPTAALRALPGVIGWLEHIYGRYPFADAGLVLDRVGVDYALETQTRPTFDGSVPTSELVHEIAHQWVGDSVTPADWGDIWLNEGFASYAEWLWAARSGPSTHQQLVTALAKHPAGDSFWKTPPTAFTDPADLFASPIYQRGAMTLQALRETVGDRAFSKLLRAWVSQGRNRNVSTSQLVHLAERLSGRHLGRFFDEWLEQPHRPTGW